ncbi:MAG: amidohydrolase, partial [Fibrobacterota bacterium]|nr:amidohydrolase [Fibrobacterota bacterium]
KDLREHIRDLRFGIVDFKWKEMERRLLRLKIAWFDCQYVFPSAWEPVISRWPGLKLCLAHFCGYDFFGDKEFPAGSTDEETGLIYGFPETDPGGLPDEKKTNPLIHGLCKLMRPENQVHFDVSFFFITDQNRESIRNFYWWARSYKGGFILDRMLWGSDWPLLATDSVKGKKLKTDQLKGYVDMNAREWMQLDPELWFRMAVVNPVRFYNLKELRPHLESILTKPAPPAFHNPALSMAEIYGNREKVSG